MNEDAGAGSNRRKRSRTATRPQGAPQSRRVDPQPTDKPAVRTTQSRTTTATGDSAAAPAGANKASRPKRGRDSGGGMRDLVGAGPSHLGVGGALRGRDVNRPTEADLAEAERDLVIVRRNWRPETT